MREFTGKVLEARQHPDQAPALTPIPQELLSVDTGFGELYTRILSTNAGPQTRYPRLARAHAIEMHMDISQEIQIWYV